MHNGTVAIRAAVDIPDITAANQFVQLSAAGVMLQSMSGSSALKDERMLLATPTLTQNPALKLGVLLGVPDDRGTQCKTTTGRTISIGAVVVQGPVQVPAKCIAGSNNIHIGECLFLQETQICTHTAATKDSKIRVGIVMNVHGGSDLVDILL